MIENTSNTNVLCRDTIYLFLVYTHLKKKSLNFHHYVYIQFANAVCKAKLMGSVPFLLREHPLQSNLVNFGPIQSI